MSELHVWELLGGDLTLCSWPYPHETVNESILTSCGKVKQSARVCCDLKRSCSCFVTLTGLGVYFGRGKVRPAVTRYVIG